MTILNCSATKCIYNDNKLCSRGDIEITGDNAHRADETSCGSFRDRTTAAMQNTAAAKRSTSTAKHRNAPTTTNVNVPPPPLMQQDAVPMAATKQNAAPLPVSAENQIP